MTGALQSSTVAAPGETVSAATDESDASALADELGRIGLQTVDDDKLSAPVEKIDIVDEETIRLWFRFPTGELIPEEFEKPVLWDVTNSKLARIVEYTVATPETFSRLETSDDIEIVLEETTVKKDSVDLEALAEAAPTSKQYNGADDGSDVLYFKEDESVGDDEYLTWHAVDPVDLVEDDRFSETDDDETDAVLGVDGVDKSFLQGVAVVGGVSFAIAGIVFLIAGWATTQPFWAVFAVFTLLAVVWVKHTG